MKCGTERYDILVYWNDLKCGFEKIWYFDIKWFEKWSFERYDTLTLKWFERSSERYDILEIKLWKVMTLWYIKMFWKEVFKGYDNLKYWNG